MAARRPCRARPRAPAARGAAARPVRPRAEGLLGVGNREGHVADPVAVHGLVPGDLVVGGEGGRQHEPDRPLLQHVGGAVAHAGLRAGVADQLEAERGAVVVRRLLGVADPELDRVVAQDREGVGRGVAHGGSSEARCERSTGQYGATWGGRPLAGRPSAQRRRSPPNRGRWPRSSVAQTGGIAPAAGRRGPRAATARTPPARCAGTRPARRRGGAARR